MYFNSPESSHLRVYDKTNAEMFPKETKVVNTTVSLCGLIVYKMIPGFL